MYQRIENEILKEQVSLKIHPFRLVTIVQWWQQRWLCLSSGSWLWLCLGIFPGACDYCDYSDCSVVTLAQEQELVLYQVQRNYVVTDVSLKRFKKLAKSVNGRASGWAYWEIRCVTQYKECYQSQYTLCSAHNITIGVKFITGTQWRLPLNINTSPRSPSTIFTVDSCSIL